MRSSTPTIAAVTSLAVVERVVGGWCDVTDPALHTGADAVVAVERLAGVIRRLTAKQAGFAERVDACRAQPRQAGSADDWLARQNGTSRGDAKRAIDTARPMKDCPVTADAFANGELSLGEADVISGAAAVDAAAEKDLVDRAKKSHDLADTKDRADWVKAGARKREDPEVWRNRRRAKRRWNEFDDDEMRATSARFVPEERARVAPVVDAYAKAIDTRWLWYPPPPAPGGPEPPPGSIPWRAPIGEHLNPFDLDDLPEPEPHPPDQTDEFDEPDEPSDTLPFGPSPPDAA